MNARTLSTAGLLVAVAALAGGCNTKSGGSGARPDDKRTTPPPVALADVTGFLFAPQPAPNYPIAGATREPLVIPNGLAQFEERQIVNAETDGLIELVATYFKPGELERLQREKKDLKNIVVYHPRDAANPPVPMKRLNDGDAVAAGDVLVFLDDQLVNARIKGATEKKAAAESALKFSSEAVDGAERRAKIVEVAYQKGTETITSLLDAMLTLARFRENEANQKQTIAQSNADLAEAQVVLARHKIKSRVNGLIRSIDRRPGQVVKAGEKLMEIESTDRVRIEGRLDVQYRDAVRRGDTVFVEPAVPSAAVAQHKNHRQPVTGVAVTAHPDGPLVVSTGADGAALVWDPNLGRAADRSAVPRNLPHGGKAVRCVAATPPGAKALLVVTGDEDGKVRVWDVSNRASLPKVPKAEPEDAHAAAVTAVAISPDGKFAATAAGRDVFIWDLATGKKQYALPAEHRDSVTSVAFTPQSELLTAARDGTAKVWKLGEKAAAAKRTLDHRAGAVDALGASPDGARVLFDQDKGRIDLIDPATGQTVGQIENGSSAGGFGPVAAFGPDEAAPGTPADKLPPYAIATAGGDGELKGTLQYWQAPRTGGRGAEVGRLITPNRAPITCVAFSPIRNQRFVVVGTAAGSVLLWEPPPATRQIHNAVVVNIDSTDTRYMTVRVEMSNTELKLMDHSAATIIIPAK
jgi:WD40 repeat protein/biotin carboxyl carrier protein